MEESHPTNKFNKKIAEVKTFSVPFAIEEIKESITLYSHSPSKLSEKQIINQALKYHSEGKLSEAARYYQYFIDQGFKNDKVFTNYGVVLKGLGKLKEAVIAYQKAIKINPNSTDAHYNLGIVFRDQGKLDEANISYKKAIKLNPHLANNN